MANIKVPKLIMMSGLSASGKSTTAKLLQEELYPNSIRVNKDLLRKMLHFGVFSGKNEGIVNEIEKVIAEYALSHGLDVIVDDTNLTVKHEIKWLDIANKYWAQFIKNKLTTPLEECIIRDMQRDDFVGADVIRCQALEAGMVEGTFFICDLDGTLCNIDHRKHYVNGINKNWPGFFSEIKNDTVNKNVLSAIKFANNLGRKVVFVSGRPEKYRNVTEEWLEKNGIDFHFTLIMRKNGDTRDDVIVKKNILNKYFKDRSKIIMVIDDRPKVVRMWQEELGNERVIDVGDGIEF